MDIMRKIENLIKWYTTKVDEKIYNNRERMEFIFLFLMVYIAIDSIILVWYTLTPMLATSQNDIFFGLSMLGYNYGYLTSNCHQMPQRSLMIGDYIMPFCARDWGIYAGCLIGALTPFFTRLPKWLHSIPALFLFSTPLVLDGVTQTIFALRESNNTLRLLTGLLLGFALAYFFAKRIVDKSGGQVVFAREIKRALNIFIIMSLALLATSYLASDDYVKAEEAIRRSGIDPNFMTYIGKRSLQTMHPDPYISSYNDAVLDQLKAYGYRGHGLWIVYEGKLGNEGRHVFFSQAEGTFKLIPDQ
jgi:uncharacterized membrane protein